MVHAENGDAIDVLVRQALAAGNTAPRYHAATRPPELEGEATNRAIQLARVAGCPLYVVHVTCKEAVEPIARAREQGWRVWGETCTQYFFVDETFLARPDFEGAKYVYSPPARDASNHDVLWDAVRTDALSAISTDHCSFLWDGQKTLGKDDFTKIPNGGPGLEDRLQMIHHFGVGGGRISLNRMVDLLATQPAKLFGLYPRKGTVAVGSDADLVIFDPEKRETISAATQHTKCDYNLYEGTEVVGAPELVLLRGSCSSRTASSSRRRASAASCGAPASASSCTGGSRARDVIRASWRIRIERPVEEVFDYVTDLERESEWNPDASNAVRTSPGEIGLGTVWEQDFRRAGHVVSTIDGYERPRLVNFHAQSDASEARVRFDFAPAGDGATDLACGVELALKGRMRLLEPLLAGTLRRRLERERGPQLKRALERT